MKLRTLPWETLTPIRGWMEGGGDLVEDMHS